MGLRKRYSKKKVNKVKILTMLLILITLTLSYKIYDNNLSTNSADLLTASYIPYNNKSQDKIIIENISKLSNKQGISKKNKSSVTFEVEGEKNKNFQVLVYPLISIVDEKDIYYYIETNNKTITNTLASLKEESGGKLIYEGKIEKNKQITIKMWLNKEIKNEINPSYEIKIR